MPRLVGGVIHFLQAPNKLTPAFFDIDPDLGDDLPSEGKLSQRKTSDCELTDTDETDAEPGDIDDPTAELADGNDPLGDNRDTIGAVLERDMQQVEGPENWPLTYIQSPSHPTLPWRDRVHRNGGRTSLAQRFLCCIPGRAS